MKKNSRITPEGTKDYLFEECLLRRHIERKLSGIFEAHDFREVVTPGMEFYDVYDPDFSGIPPEAMFKMTDRQGRLIVMRPDNTLSVARLTATRLQNVPRPVRLYYSQPVYRNNPGFAGRRNENLQMGVELLGAGGVRADLETLAAAVESLSACVPGFRLEIGHAAFFKALAESIGVSGEKKEGIRKAVGSKNNAALCRLLGGAGECTEVRAMRKLPQLFGGEEVFEKAAPLFTGKLKNTLGYLQGIYHELDGFGLGGRLIIDLGLVQRNDYYTGIIFSAYAEGCGEAVLRGGRYDHLLEHFGVPMPAVGFGIDVDAVADIRFKNGESHVPTPPDVLVYGESGCEVKALEHGARLAKHGMRCENSVLGSEKEALQYARETGIGRVDIVGSSIRTVPAGGKV